MEGIILANQGYRQAALSSSPEPEREPASIPGPSKEKKKRSREEKEARKAEKERKREAKRVKKEHAVASKEDGVEEEDRMDPALRAQKTTSVVATVAVAVPPMDDEGAGHRESKEERRRGKEEKRKRKETKKVQEDQDQAKSAIDGNDVDGAPLLEELSNRPTTPVAPTTYGKRAQASSKVRVPPTVVEPASEKPNKRKRPSSPAPTSTTPSTPAKGRIITSRPVRPPTPSSSTKPRPTPREKRSQSQARSQTEDKVDDETLRMMLAGPKAVEEWMAKTWVREEEMRRLERVGVLTYKKGKFSEDEKIAIRKVLSNYQRVHRLSDAQLVDLIMASVQSSGLDKDDLRGFWLDLAAAVPGRPVVYVQSSVRRLFNPKGHKGAWTPEEDEALLRAYQLYPNQWSKISDVVERTNHDCRDRYMKELSVKSGRSLGRWSEEEDDSLLDNIRKLNRSLGRDEDERDDISWELVAKGMGGSRSAKQCRVRWTDAILPKMDGRTEHDMKVDRILLLDRLDELNLKSEKHIDWAEVMKGSRLSHLSKKHVTNVYFNTKRRMPDVSGLGFQDFLRAMRKYSLTHGRGIGQPTRSGPPTTKVWIEEDGELDELEVDEKIDEE